MQQAHTVRLRRGMKGWAHGRRLVASSMLACLISFGWPPHAVHGATQDVEACAGITQPLPLPSAMLLRDYERVLFRWLYCRGYAKVGWAADKAVRDTGPFIDGKYYGTHPAVKIYYSPQIIDWLQRDRKGPIADGAVIVKEMYSPPAAIYADIHRGLERRYAGDLAAQEKAYGEALDSLLSGWTVMVRDRSGSKDGWFWAGSGNAATLEALYEGNLTHDYSNPPGSAFGEYGCLRCHSSAAAEFTFSSLKNIAGFPGTPLRFRVDESWRSQSYITKLPNWTAIEAARDAAGIEMLFPLAQQEIPQLELITLSIGEHAPSPPSTQTTAAQQQPDAVFVNAYASTGMTPPTIPRAFPPEYADHVIPGAGGPDASDVSAFQYITSDTCVGCHGGLGGAPSGVTMFLKTGTDYGEGYNVSEYGEWRWSPMGLAGRDPIFHAQIESEMLLLRRDAQKDPSPLQGPLADTQQAVIDTCLRCHGAMGQRQLAIDAAQKRTLAGGGALNGHFNLEYFNLVERLSAHDPIPEPPKGGVNPPIDYADGEFYQYHRYGALAREGVSCAICHRIAGPAESEVTAWAEGIRSKEPAWLETNLPHGVDAMAYQFMNNSTGRYDRNKADELYGPFAKVAVKPMEHALGITPKAAPPGYGAIVPPGGDHPPPFTADSQMCGTCHTINLPNIGQKVSADNAVLNAATPNPAFASYNHSIEQATFAEWQNSDFGPGLDNHPKVSFKSCQDCHMPGGFRSLDGSIKIDQLVTEIATIQDTSYPEADHALPPEAIEVPQRDDYRRHELVGLNVFMLEMAKQFPQIIGVSLKDKVMTYADTGSQLAIDNMLRQAREATVALTIEQASIKGRQLEATVNVENLTGHRFPSGAAFRRAFLEFQVLEDGEAIWASGRTNAAGVLVDAKGRPLRTEFLNQFSDGNRFADYQPHYQRISAQDQVQIYEILELDGYPKSAQTFPQTSSDKLPQFTTSFIHRVHEVKDNRLLPRGWVPSKLFESQGEIMRAFMKSTDPDGASVIGGKAEIGARPMPNGALTNDAYQADPNYVVTDIGTDRLNYSVTLKPGVDAGKLSVKLTMYSQSFSPAWLHERFSLAAMAKAQGLPTPAADRLYHIASHLRVEGTAIEDWKLPLVSVERAVPVVFSE